MGDRTGARELALMAINEGGENGADYRARCAIEWARTYEPGGTAEQLTQAAERIAARRWLDVALNTARAYERRYGTRGTSSFTAADILAASLELAEYYARHLAEMTDAERRAAAGVR